MALSGRENVRREFCNHLVAYGVFMEFIDEFVCGTRKSRWHNVEALTEELLNASRFVRPVAEHEVHGDASCNDRTSQKSLDRFSNHGNYRDEYRGCQVYDRPDHVNLERDYVGYATRIGSLSRQLYARIPRMLTVRYRSDAWL